MNLTLADFTELLGKKGFKPSAAIFSTNGELGFFKQGEAWRVDLTDDFEAFGPAMPGYIPEDKIEEFYTWFRFAGKVEYDKGRQFGEQAMRSAICGLLGAAQLTAFDPAVQG